MAQQKTLSAESIWSHLDQLTKPRRSLGKLEALAFRLCQVQQTLSPRTTPRRLVLFAGDHGVVEEGVSAWPSAVTSAMIDNIRKGGSASAVLARQYQTDLQLVDVGSFRDDSAETKIRRGTRNLAREPALTLDEFREAVEVGRQSAAQAKSDGMSVVATGEMGIGNTTPAACLTVLLADVPVEQAVGRGAGADDTTLRRKLSIVEEAVQSARQRWNSDPMTAIAAVSGVEIASMAGFFIGARQQALTVVLDGYVATAGALIAEFLQPNTAKSLIAAHLSVEPGHQGATAKLGLEPFLDWDLRLGEGTGALLLMPLLDAAAAMVSQMATFADIGVD